MKCMAWFCSKLKKKVTLFFYFLKNLYTKLWGSINTWVHMIYFLIIVQRQTILNWMKIFSFITVTFFRFIIHNLFICLHIPKALLIYFIPIWYMNSFIYMNPFMEHSIRIWYIHRNRGFASLISQLPHSNLLKIQIL